MVSDGTIAYRLIGQTDALGDTGSISYDANGNKVKTTDGNGNSESFTYDANNLQTTSSDALGDKVSNSYDADGNLTQTIDAMGNKTTNKYDAGGRLTSVTDANNGVSTCQYTATGNIAALTGAAGGVTNYTYDNAGRKISESTPSNGKITYTYNALNLVSELTNARGQKRDYTYDAAGRIASFTDAEGKTSYTYDKNGNVLTVTDAQGTITRQYDGLNRVIKYTDVNKNVVQYTYDEVGNLATIVYPNGGIVTYSYDGANRLIKVTDWANRVTNYTYDKNNNLISTTRPDGSVLTETYDAAERLIGIKDVDKSGNTINCYASTYNANGQVTKEVTSNVQNTSTMTYDVLGRLLGRTDTDSTGKVTGSNTYTYDLAGNVTSGGDTVSYDQNNRLTAYNGTNIGYDADGNMTTGVVNGASSSLTYDSKNRLLQAAGTSYTYDALDNRISETVGGKSTTYVYDDSSSDLSKMLVSTDSTGKSTYYIYGAGLIGEQDPNGNYLIYHYDLRGSTTAITNMQNTVTDRYTYGAYGELLSHTGTSATPFLFNGRDGVVTDSNGLYYMRARYYSPTLKRFINADTLKGSINNGETLNNYAYANGNPISMVDPFGRCADSSSTDDNWLNAPAKEDIFDKFVHWITGDSSPKTQFEQQADAQFYNMSLDSQMMAQDMSESAISDVMDSVSADYADEISESLAQSSIPSNYKGMGEDYYHSANPSVVDLMKESGFRTDLPNPQAAWKNNRFGSGVYLADSPETALAERPGGTILKINADIGKNLDVTNRGIIDYDMGQAIARGSRKQGYNSITFLSNAAKDQGFIGVNTMIFDPTRVSIQEVLP